MADDGTRRRGVLFEESQPLITRAKALVEAAQELCETARSLRTETATSRSLRSRRTAELVKAIEKAGQDLQMLKARIDTAARDVLAPSLKRRLRD